MPTTPASPKHNTERRPTTIRGGLVIVPLLLAVALAGCSPAESTRTTFPPQTFATPSKLSTTVTPPPPMLDPRTPVDVATTFLTEYAGGNVQQACQLATSELQRDLGAQCDSTEVLERLPAITVIDTCPMTPGNNVEFQVRFHVVPGVGKYPLPVRGDPQDLVVRVQGSGHSYDVVERPTATEPGVACTDATT